MQATLEGDDVRARIVSRRTAGARPRSRVQKGLRIFLRDDGPLAGIASAALAGEGEVSLVLMLEADRSEVEMHLPGQFNVTAEIAGALKAIPGIVAVEHV